MFDFDLIYKAGNIEMQIFILKNIFISLCSYFLSLKLINKKVKFNFKFIFVNLIIIFISIICGIIKFEINYTISLICQICMLSLILSKNSRSNIGSSIVTMFLSFAINYVIFNCSVILNFVFNMFLKINDYLNLLVIIIIHIFILWRVMHIKRIKHGIAFLQNNNKYDSIDILVLNIGVGIVFINIFIANYEKISSRATFLGLIIFSIIMFITIQKSLQLYYKQKMLIKELDETKEDLARAENKIKILEKENIEESKKRHTVIHKQKSIEYKIEEMLTKTEISTEEAAEVRERLEKLNKEVYTEKEVMELDKTGISSIDDMLKYMQSECVKNKIDFTLQIKGNIHYMVHNLVKEEELETLLADHIKDAIIAINHTDNANRSILVRLGNIDDIYSLYIYDSGVEFKPEVIENLGKKPCTTYASEGGTGMGFMNTFDTVRKHKASLIIEEIGKPTEDNYTKAIIIKFDKKNEFKVKSYHEIEKV